MSDLRIVRAVPGSIELSEAIATRHQIFCRMLQLVQCDDFFPGAPHDIYDRSNQTLHFLGSALLEDKSSRAEHWFGVGTGRLIVADALPDLPSGRLLNRLPYQPPVDSSVCYSEPSRVGIFPLYGTPRKRRQLLLRLAGILTEASVDVGASHFLITMLPSLRMALKWFPWELAERPLSYPPSEGGPEQPASMSEPLAVWVATMNLHELVRVVKKRGGDTYDLMFPSGTPWFDSRFSRSDEALARLHKRNLELVRDNGANLQQLSPPEKV